MNEVLIYVRLTREAASGERGRSVHLVAVAQAPADALVALCGREFRPGEAERLDIIAGMPCFGCLIASSTEQGSSASANPPGPGTELERAPTPDRRRSASFSAREEVRDCGSIG